MSKHKKHKQKRKASTMSHGNYQQYWGYYDKCSHSGTVALFDVNGRVFHPVNSGGAKIISGCAAFVDLAGIYPLQGRGFIDMKETTLPGADKLLERDDTTQVLRLNWPDHGVPPPYCGVRFWRAVIDALPVGKIGVGCIGSHGRTGTFLSLLRIIYFGDSAPNAINWVRVHHCANAVESLSQERYLWQIAKTVGTLDQPYNQELADQLNKASTEVVQTTPTWGPSTHFQAGTPTTKEMVRYPALNLVEVQYLDKEGTLVHTPAHEWAKNDYFMNVFRRRTKKDSRLLIYR